MSKFHQTRQKILTRTKNFRNWIMSSCLGHKVKKSISPILKAVFSKPVNAQKISVVDTKRFHNFFAASKASIFTSLRKFHKSPSSALYCYLAKSCQFLFKKANKNSIEDQRFCEKT